MGGQKWFITGIGTDVGKTVASAVFTEAFKADYWKPVQAGMEDGTDAETVPDLAPSAGIIHSESYRLKTPMSPHAAAAREKLTIELSDIGLPHTQNHLVVEGAGGLMVPLNEQETILDLIELLGIEVVLVSRHYLGSINHTLLSIEALRTRNISIGLLVFIGDHPETEAVILKMSGIDKVFKIPETDVVDRSFIKTQAERLLRNLDI